MDKGDTPRCMPEKGEPVYNGLKELRDSLGLSENGLRLYEREGLMRCWRKEANNYRFTTLSEGIRLCGSYSLVRTGFSISEVRDLIALPRDEYTEALDGICKDLTHDLQLLAARKEQLERHIDALHSYMHDPFKCTETEPPVHFVVAVFAPCQHVNDCDSQREMGRRARRVRAVFHRFERLSVSAAHGARASVLHRRNHVPQRIRHLSIRMPSQCRRVSPYRRLVGKT